VLFSNVIIDCLCILSHVLGECFLSRYGLSITRFSSLEIYPANTLKDQVEKDKPIVFSGVFGCHIYNLFLNFIGYFELFECMYFGYYSFYTMFIESMLCIHFLMLISRCGCYPPPYFRNWISFIFKQDDPGTVTRFIIILLHQFIQSVSFIIRKQSEAVYLIMMIFQNSKLKVLWYLNKHYKFT
jgi:hypothetical protein